MAVEKVLRGKKAIAVFVLPAVVLYLVIVFVPMLQSIYYTLFEGTPNVNMEWRGLRNYALLFSDAEFVDSLSVTLRYLLFVSGGWVLLGLSMSLLLMYGLTKRQVDVARTITYLPVVIPSVAVAGIFSKFFALTPNYGILNTLLDAVGLGSSVQAWTGQSSTALMTVCVADLWRGCGYYTILFYAGLLNVPRDLEEAAQIDGAGRLQTIRHIVLPTIRPVTFMCVILALTNAMRVYDMPVVLTSGGPGRATETLSIYMYKVAFSNWKYGYGSTLAIVILALSIGLTQFVSSVERKEETKP